MRSLRCLLAAYIFAWFSIVVPGHTRGIVTIPGTECGECAVKTSSCCATKDGQKQSSPTPDQQRRCAICFFAATYGVSISYPIYLEPTDRVEIISARAISQVMSIDYPTPFWPVGPPAAA